MDTFGEFSKSFYQSTSVQSVASIESPGKLHYLRRRWFSCILDMFLFLGVPLTLYCVCLHIPNRIHRGCNFSTLQIYQSACPRSRFRNFSFQKLQQAAKLGTFLKKLNVFMVPWEVCEAFPKNLTLYILLQIAMRFVENSLQTSRETAGCYICCAIKPTLTWKAS